MNTSLKEKTLDKIYWVFIALVCFIHGALLIPNVDDGIYFYQIYNTIRFYNPFYNDFYGQYFHFMKPTILLHALLYSINNNPSFRLIALVQSAEIFACTWLLYLCARRYASEVASKAGALIFLYFLFVHMFLSPTRPETTVLFRTVEMMSSKIIYDRAEHRIKGAQGLVLAGGMFNFCGENIFPVEGFRTQISSTQGTNIIEVKSIASVYADLINAHPLVKFFGSTHNYHKESKWVSRRSLGNEFQLIINSNDVWKMRDYIESQVKPLHYSIIKEIPLSNKLLDRYADPAVKRLQCIEYRRLNLKP